MLLNIIRVISTLCALRILALEASKCTNCCIKMYKLLKLDVRIIELRCTDYWYRCTNY